MDLSLERVSVEIAGARLLDELSLDVAAGGVLGLIGPNGSGKTTALRCVYRALRPTGGVVRLDGDDLSAMSLRDSARVIAALTQEGGSDLDFTVAEIVALGRTPHQRGNGPLSPRDGALCQEAMERMDIGHLAHRGVLELSGGERRRVLMARCLVQEPRVLVLDEPTNHLDVRHQVGLLSLLRDSGVTALLVLHDLNLAASSCDRLAVLCEGRLTAAGTPEEVLTPELVAQVFGVQADVVTHPQTGAPQLLYTLPTHSPQEGPS